MALHFLARWPGRQRQRAFKLPPDTLLLEVQEARQRIAVKQALDKLDERQIKRDDFLALDVTIEVRHARRSLDANALMWALYEVEADVQNGGQPDPEKRITKDTLYEQDMRDVAPSRPIVVKLDVVKDLRDFGVKVRQVIPVEGTDLCKAYVYKTSSQFDTLEMHRHIKFLFDRIALHGVPVEDSGDIEKYWLEWRRHLNDEKILLEAEQDIGPTEYARATPLCEATGASLGRPGEPGYRGHVAHIKSVGAGGAMPPWDKPRNWLHLEALVHLGEWHTEGVERFVGKYPHLEYKVRSALGGEA